MATFASKKWGKQAFNCQECGYEFRKAWIEPMFMIRDFIRQDHEWYHNAATDENHPLVKAWTEWERHRIIGLLKDNLVICNGHWSHSCLDESNCHDYNPQSRQKNWHGKGPCEAHFMGGDCNDLIELINGAQK